MGIDAHTGTVVDRVDVGGVAGWTAYQGDSLWVGVDSPWVRTADLVSLVAKMG